MEPKQLVDPEYVYQSRVVSRDDSLYLEPVDGLSVTIQELETLDFQIGSSLFVSMMQSIYRMGYHPIPDDPISMIPDPLKILAGKERLPWRPGNPIADECVKCYYICVKDPVAGYNCYWVCGGYSC